MDFNPNQNGPLKVPGWATYMPDRNPKFKVHTTRSHAMNAFKYRDKVILYKLEAEKWVEVYRIDFDETTDRSCENCHGDADVGVYTSLRWISKDPLRRGFRCSPCNTMIIKADKG